MSDAADPVRLRKLRFRAWHRGFREADFIMGGFADRCLDAFTTAQLDQFEALLDEPDQLLYAWIIGFEAAPGRVQGEVFALLQQFQVGRAEGPGSNADVS